MATTSDILDIHRLAPERLGASYIHPTLFGFHGRFFGCRAVSDHRLLSLRLKRGEEA